MENILKVFFFKHKYLRDRHLDTIKQFNNKNNKKYLVQNFKDFENMSGSQVDKIKSLKPKKLNIKNIFPLLNIKLRPKNADKDSIVYVFGALILTGKFIIEIDNPWCLVGYNFRGLKFYKLIIRHLLLSNRCLEIRTISEACRNSLKEVFGKEVYSKSKCIYPIIRKNKNNLKNFMQNKITKFLFVSTQFEIKGGYQLINVFKKIYEENKNCELTIISYLPNNLEKEIANHKGINFLESNLNRSEIYKHMENSDVLVMPTYYDSFGMIILEALSHSLAIISNNTYAISEMCINNVNGQLLDAPISCWSQFMPSEIMIRNKNFNNEVKLINFSSYEEKLFQAIKKIVLDRELLLKYRKNSENIFSKKFAIN